MLSIILAILFLILILLIKKKHAFWDKQPVMRKNYNKISTISKIPKFKINLKESGIIVKNTNNLQQVFKFINCNFNPYYEINYHYFKNCYLNKTSINIGFYKNNNLVGFIHCRDTDVNYKNDIIKFKFVDYLCVHEDYRKRNLASIIISSLLKNYSDSFTHFLFKIEGYSLPFKNIIKTNYYYKKIENITNFATKIRAINELESKNYLFYYQFYKNQIKKYDMYCDIDFNSFVKEFVFQKISNMLIIEINNSLAIIVGKTTYYKIGKNRDKCFDIDFLLGKTSINLNKHLEKYLYNQKYVYYTIPDIGNNSSFIKNNNLELSQRLYYYTYNLTFPKITKNKFLINI